MLPGRTPIPAFYSTETGDNHTAPPTVRPTDRPTAAPDAHNSLTSGGARRGHEGVSERADTALVERKHNLRGN